MSETKYCIPCIKGSRLSCTLVGALSVLLNLRDTVVLLHGTPGCAHYGMKFCQQMLMRKQELLPDFGLPNIRFTSTGMTENELIFGGEEKLSRKIRETLEQFPGRPLLVIPSCTVEVIGDDVSGVCDAMAEETGRQVIYFNMGGFLKGDHYEGINTAYLDVIDRFLAPSSAVDSGLVNLVAEPGIMPIADFDYWEIRRLLQKIGLRINTRFIVDLPFEDLPKVTRAGLNLPAARNQSLAVCSHLHERFGMPYISQGFPSGFKDTREWLDAILTVLGMKVDLDGIMEEEKRFFVEEVERLGNPFKGLRVIVNAAPVHLGWLMEFLDLVQADLVEVNLLNTRYFEANFLDDPGTFPCPVNKGLGPEEMLARNSEKKADLYLQSFFHQAPLPHLQPGLLVKEVPLHPPVGPRGMLDLFADWSRWMRFTGVEGWRHESLERLA